MSDHRMRLDVFLWRARFFKTRGAASNSIEMSGARIERDGHVRRTDKPSAPLEPGDILSFTSPSGARLVRVVGLPQRRGPPAEAAMCYEPVKEGSTGGGAAS